MKKHKSNFRKLTKVIGVSIICSLLAYGCSNQSEPVKSVSPIEAKDLLATNANAMILDVRTPEEFALSHIEGAININIYDQDFAERAATLDRDKTYIVHCAANVPAGRSEKSLEILSELGFQRLVSLEGGFTAWSGEGLEVTTNTIQSQ
ncbi:MAG: rhodanese-like domain-containing protein [Bacteroidota bacterium]